MEVNTVTSPYISLLMVFRAHTYLYLHPKGEHTLTEDPPNVDSHQTMITTPEMQYDEDYTIEDVP